MKAKHRHELKQNELTEFIAHFPEWLNRNRNYIITVLVILVAYTGWYYWKKAQSKSLAAEQQQCTTYINRLSQLKLGVLQQGNQGIDISYMLVELAKEIEDFAFNASNNNIAATAWIKAAEALRSDLHYRVEIISPQDLANQMQRAKDNYLQALNLATLPTLKAEAEFGIAICDEDTGNFEDAKTTYRAILDNEEYASTTIAEAAKSRLSVMEATSAPFAFKMKNRPAPPVQRPLEETIKIEVPEDANVPQLLDKDLILSGPNDASQG